MSSRTRVIVLSISAPVIVFAIVGGFLGKVMAREEAYQNRKRRGELEVHRPSIDGSYRIDWCIGIDFGGEEGAVGAGRFESLPAGNYVLTIDWAAVDGRNRVPFHVRA